MRERGMLKWAPYKSLEAQADYLAKLEYERNKQPCPHISSDKAMAINEILTNYNGEVVIAKYWHDGYIYTIHGRIDSVSKTEHFMSIDDVEIPFKVLTNLTFEE